MKVPKRKNITVDLRIKSVLCEDVIEDSKLVRNGKVCVTKVVITQVQALRRVRTNTYTHSLGMDFNRFVTDNDRVSS